MEARHLALDEAADEAAQPLDPVTAAGGLWPAAGRRAFDLAGASLLLLLGLPVLLAIALAIRLDSRGPVLFRQRRVGLGGAPFTCFKFRTMVNGADPERHREYIEHLMALGDQAESGEGSLYKLVIDDRITRVGRLLRRWSLDELPQLLNVVRGEMSLVGPRPVIPYEVELYPAHYRERFAVKPGLTGLWQVSGRNECTYEEMVDLDIAYVRRRSLRLDLGILAKTVWVVVRRRGAA